MKNNLKAGFNIKSHYVVCIENDILNNIAIRSFKFRAYKSSFLIFMLSTNIHIQLFQIEIYHSKTNKNIYHSRLQHSV